MTEEESINKIINKNSLNTLSEYDKEMTEKYHSQIKDGVLQIQSDSFNQLELKSLDFIKALNIKKLVLRNLLNVISKLQSKTITDLIIENCINFQNPKDFELENLEYFKVMNCFNQGICDQTLVYDLRMFQKLKDIHLRGCMIDMSPLSQMNNLIKLTLNDCGIRNTDMFRTLTNLVELGLSLNKGIKITSLRHLNKLTSLSLCHCELVQIDELRPLINLLELYLHGNKCDISPVQYLTKLTKLGLEGCNQVNLDVLQQLVNLQEIQLYDNSIVYIQPLARLKQIIKLSTFKNYIIDIPSVQHHPNFEKFDFSFQVQPSFELLKRANIFRSINKPITLLKSIDKNFKQVYTFRQKLEQCLKQCQQDQAKLFSHVSLFFERINVFDSHQ
ncbi:leucine-rich_repeat domain-containing protein [Hexamita inflata]|uniref:Leucine-rich repeat domain-containing protein n=1 Tax=Hexamita inflata TaxID=28002 RepID=A0AA86REV8_9EUKA|nr:leucine-rich repeat domain-containing protein [Hexamita inflata]